MDPTLHIHDKRSPQPPLQSSISKKSYFSLPKNKIKMVDPKSQQDHSYAKTNLDTRLSENNNNCISSPSDEDVLQFRPNNKNYDQESDDSKVCSPPLWKNSPSPSPSRRPSHPLLSHHCSSPNARKKAIARGQRELMEMVKNMPESSYELSLKDIVEHRDMEIGKKQILKKMGVFVKVKIRGNKKNGSFDDKGMFLKMGILPFSLQSKKSKGFGDSNNGGGEKVNKISSDSKTEKDWWKKKFTGSNDSDRSRISSSSGGGGSSSTQSYGGGGSSSSSQSCGGQRKKKHGFVTDCSCCPFLKPKITTKSTE